MSNFKQTMLKALVCILLFPMSLLSVEAQITLSVKDRTVKEVIREIESISEYRFFYNDDLPGLEQRVNVEGENLSINRILEQIEKQSPLTYVMRENNQIVLSSAEILQQQNLRKISGVILDEAGEPIIGANVMIKGTTRGIISGIDGDFVLDVPENSTLLISYIGYLPQEIRITNQNTLRIILMEDSKLISEVVVTALGIKREEKALGYSVQKVDGEQLALVKGGDISSSLSGRIAGLNIKNNPEFASEPTIRLRGYQPILVVDGIPFKNVTLADIPADDIESVDVLKGATAAALYGSQGRDGVIMITTKKAQKEGLNVSVNSNTMFNAGYLTMPEVQTAYSSGANGVYKPGDYVWGDRMDIGRTAQQYNPYTYEWEEMPLVSKGKDNFSNFLQQAFVTNNNISVSQKGEYGSVRGSLTHVYNKGQFPNQQMNKFAFNLGGTIEWKNLSIDMGITYNKQIYPNDRGLGYGVGGYMYNLLVWTGAEYDIRDYRNYWREGKKDREQNWMDEAWYDNPYFLAYERTRSKHNDLTNSYFNLNYTFTDWLKGMARVGGDAYRKRSETREAISARNNLRGSYGISNTTGYSVNSDFLLLADKRFGDFNVDGFMGGSLYFYEEDYQTSSTQNGLNMPGFYSLNASNDPVTSSSSIKKSQTNSLYAKVGFSWKSMLFLEVTGRNDWVSTLDSSERSYFYPSVSGSAILSEFIPLPEVISFWKLRASWAQTKKPVEPYEINRTYTISRNYWGDETASFYPKMMRDLTLKPQSAESYEIGTAFNMFNNRLKVDLAYYHKREYNMQIEALMSYTTGFEKNLINYGQEELSYGVELTINGDIIHNRDFGWNSTVNWSLDRYRFHKLDEDYSPKRPWIKEGSDWYRLEYYDFERDPQGNIIHYNGLPKASDYPILAGSKNPSWIWGWQNSFRYKDFRLNIALDGRVGGYMFNYMERVLWHSGRHIDSDNQWRYSEVVEGNKNYIGTGVKILSGSVRYDSDGNILEDTRVFAPNDTEVSYETYIRQAYGGDRSNTLRKKTFFKLREISLGYTIPQTVCEKLKIKGAEVAFVGQNLLMWTKDFRFSDPDRDEENLNAPAIRYVGANFKFNF